MPEAGSKEAGWGCKLGTTSIPSAYMDTQGVKVIRQYALSHLKTDLFHTIFIPNWDQSLTFTANIIMVSLNPFLAPFFKYCQSIFIFNPCIIRLETTLADRSWVFLSICTLNLGSSVAAKHWTQRDLTANSQQKQVSMRAHLQVHRFTGQVQVYNFSHRSPLFHRQVTYATPYELQRLRTAFSSRCPPKLLMLVFSCVCWRSTRA